MKVGRCYTFHGRHSVPSLPEPWCIPHTHEYTIELVVEVTALNEHGLSINHEEMDKRFNTWLASAPRVSTLGLTEDGATSNTIDLDVSFDHTTVEALAREFRDLFGVAECTVMEDDDRWACAP